MSEENGTTSPQIELIRAKVRPTITKILTGVWSGITAFVIVWGVLNGMDVMASLALDKYYQALTALTMGTVLWYFGDRLYFKRKQMNGNSK